MKFTFVSASSDEVRGSATLAAGLVASILLLALAVAGCSSGEENELDVNGAEAQITSELASRFDVAARELNCPDQVTVKAGATFGCDGEERGGKSFSIEVRLIGDSGRFTFSKPQFKGG